MNWCYGLDECPSKTNVSTYWFSGWHYRSNGNFGWVGADPYERSLGHRSVLEGYCGIPADGPTLFIFSYCLPGPEVSSLLYHASTAVTIWHLPAKAQSNEFLWSWTRAFRIVSYYSLFLIITFKFSLLSQLFYYSNVKLTNTGGH